MINNYLKKSILIISTLMTIVISVVPVYAKVEPTEASLSSSEYAKVSGNWKQTSDGEWVITKINSEGKPLLMTDSSGKKYFIDDYETEKEETKTGYVVNNYYTSDNSILLQTSNKEYGYQYFTFDNNGVASTTQVYYNAEGETQNETAEYNFYDDASGWKIQSNTYQYWVNDGEYINSGYAILPMPGDSSKYNLFKFANGKCSNTAGIATANSLEELKASLTNSQRSYATSSLSLKAGEQTDTDTTLADMCYNGEWVQYNNKWYYYLGEDDGCLANGYGIVQEDNGQYSLYYFNSSAVASTKYSDLQNCDSIEDLNNKISMHSDAAKIVQDPCSTKKLNSITKFVNQGDVNDDPDEDDPDEVDDNNSSTNTSGTKKSSSSKSNKKSNTKVTDLDGDGEDDEIISNNIKVEKINATQLLSDEAFSWLGAEDYKYDLFCMYLTGDLGDYDGMRDYLKEKQNLDNFEEVLKDAKYEGSKWRSIIEKALKLLDIASFYFTGKENMEYDTKTMSAMAERNIVKQREMRNQLTDTILFIIGCILIAYSLILFLSWVIDFTGILTIVNGDGEHQGLYNIVSFGKLKACAGNADLGKEYVGFVRALITSGSIILIAILCISPTARMVLTHYITLLISFIKSLLNKVLGLV